jgi:predicted ribosome quality control (RQC) complex YloA/Tae2 family protein
MQIPKELLEYAPIVLVVVIFLVNYKIFVTPTQLSDAEKSINDAVDKKLEKLENKTASKEAVNALTSEICDMKKKIDKIYDYILQK